MPPAERPFWAAGGGARAGGADQQAPRAGAWARKRRGQEAASGGPGEKNGKLKGGRAGWKMNAKNGWVSTRREED